MAKSLIIYYTNWYYSDVNPPCKSSVIKGYIDAKAKLIKMSDGDCINSDGIILDMRHRLPYVIIIEEFEEDYIRGLKHLTAPDFALIGKYKRARRFWYDSILKMQKYDISLEIRENYEECTRNYKEIIEILLYYEKKN